MRFSVSKVSSKEGCFFDWICTVSYTMLLPMAAIGTKTRCFHRCEHLADRRYLQFSRMILHLEVCP